MKVRIRRIDKSLPLPKYHTKGAACFDGYARETTVIPARATTFVPLNKCLKPPRGHFALMAARSSLPKRGLMMANGVGILDEDYSGNGDEYKAFLHNFTDAPVTVERGERIVQIVFLPFTQVEWEEVDDMGEADRGGFGSTGR